jgi:drug/metabolite transporter (DMT)-like permease
MNYFIILCVVSVLAVGQVMFKIVSTRIGDKGFSALATDYTALGIFAGSLAIYGIATIAWILAIRQVPLSTAYLFMSLAFIMVPVMSHYVLGEPLNIRIAIGGAFIIGGILIAASSPA